MEVGYLCGPMTGLPKNNFPAFREAAAKLRSQGFTVISPTEMNEADEHYEDTVDHSTTTIRKFAKRDIDALSKCSCIFVMKNTQKSKGCKAEKSFARWTRMKFYYLDEHFNVFRSRTWK